MELNKELDEILDMAFVGQYIRDADGNFHSLDDRFNVLKDGLRGDIQALITKSNTEAVREFAGRLAKEFRDRCLDNDEGEQSCELLFEELNYWEKEQRS